MRLKTIQYLIFDIMDSVTFCTATAKAEHETYEVTNLYPQFHIFMQFLQVHETFFGKQFLLFFVQPSWAI